MLECIIKNSYIRSKLFRALLSALLRSLTGSRLSCSRLAGLNGLALARGLLHGLSLLDGLGGSRLAGGLSLGNLLLGC